ncbi:MAG: O-methyltransferase [Bacteroidota bacterium]
MIRRIVKYLGHLFCIRHRKGRGIHSPYVFEFVHEILFNARGMEVPEEIVRIHRELREDDSLIPEDRLWSRSVRKPAGEGKTDPGRRGPAGKMDPECGGLSGDHRKGAGSRVDRSEERTVRSFVRGSSVTPRYGALLYRIAGWFRPEMILELGTGVGISTLYLGSGAPRVPLHSMEGNTEKAAMAASLACRCGLEQVSIHWGPMDRKLEEFLPQLRGRFLAFIDANHRYEPVIWYMRMILSRAGEDGVIVLDDIYWSKEMEKAWKEVISWPQVKVSVDLFRMGILFLREDLQKMHLKINF